MMRLSPHELKLNPKNPRTISREKLDQLMQSLEEFPEMLEVRPVVVDPDMVVLGGNQRLLAARELGLETVPVQVVTWEEAKQREFVIKDNVSFGEWDWDHILEDWQQEELEEWGLDVPDMEKTTKVQHGKPEVSITQEVLEEHNYVVFVFDNKLDWNVVREALEIETVAKPGYTDTYMQKGIGRVLKGEKLLRLIGNVHLANMDAS